MGRINNWEVDIEVGSKFGSGYSKFFELKDVEKVYYRYDNSVDKFIKGVNCGFSVRVGNIIG